MKKGIEITKDILTDVNAHDRRFFRCWLDGSYLGYDHYKANVAFLLANHDKPKALRAFVINNWCKYLAHEEEVSPDTIRRRMVNMFTAEELDNLNAQLIEDALDLIADDLAELEES